MRWAHARPAEPRAVQSCFSGGGPSAGQQTATWIHPGCLLESAADVIRVHVQRLLRDGSRRPRLSANVVSDCMWSGGATIGPLFENRRERAAGVEGVMPRAASPAPLCARRWRRASERGRANVPLIPGDVKDTACQPHIPLCPRHRRPCGRRLSPRRLCD